MVFSTALFLFGFFPLVLAAYFIAPRALKNAVLLLASLLFYAWGEQGYATILLGSILGNYVAGQWLARRPSPGLLAAAVAGNLLILVVFKYANFLVDNFNGLVGHELIHLGKVPLPLGVSFFTFQGIAYVVDVYHAQVKPANTPQRYALYAALFPHLVAGPIVRYRDIEDQLDERPFSLDQISSGIRRLLIGLAKKLVLANIFGQYADEVFRLPPLTLSAGLAWLGLACYTMQIYFDFSAYSDMAIGLGKIFGFTFLENFNYPYIASSVTDFWRRWHISLSSWLRDYLYIPLGGNRRGPTRTYLHLMIVFLLCGLWHGAKWNFVVWGAWHGTFLVAERGLRFVKWPSGLVLLQHAYTLVVVMLGWVLFRADSLPQAWEYGQSLFGGGAGRVAFADLWNRELLGLFVVGIPACMPIAPAVREWLRTRDRSGWIAAGTECAELVVCSALCLVIVPALCGGTFNPFLYFRF